MMKKLNGNQIKMIAIIAMFMDHFATTFYPNYEKYGWLLLIHLIGRVAAPIMWFMVVEGYTHTHSLKKYLERLLIFQLSLTLRITSVLAYLLFHLKNHS